MSIEQTLLCTGVTVIVAHDPYDRFLRVSLPPRDVVPDVGNRRFGHTILPGQAIDDSTGTRQLGPNCPGLFLRQLGVSVVLASWHCSMAKPILPNILQGRGPIEVVRPVIQRFPVVVGGMHARGGRRTVPRLAYERMHPYWVRTPAVYDRVARDSDVGLEDDLSPPEDPAQGTDPVTVETG